MLLTLHLDVHSCGSDLAFHDAHESVLLHSADIQGVTCTKLSPGPQNQIPLGNQAFKCIFRPEDQLAEADSLARGLFFPP